MDLRRPGAGPGPVRVGLLLLTLFNACSAPTPSEAPWVVPEIKVETDFATLKAVLLLPIRQGHFRTLSLAPGHPLARDYPPGVVEEHQELVRILERNGVRVFDVRDLANEAILVLRRQGGLREWLDRNLPQAGEGILRHLDELDADSLFNLREDHFYAKDAEGGLSPLSTAFLSMYWSRDFAIMTPRGVIIGNGRRFERAIENSLARVIFQQCRDLEGFPIVFDALEEEVFLDGGDVIVLDPSTLLVGVGNRSSPEAASKLARRLGMDVLAVQMPPGDKAGGLQRQLLHLDTIFNVVSADTVVAVPYFLEKGFQDNNPVLPLLEGSLRQLQRLKEAKADYEIADPERIQVTIDAIPEVGWVTRYQALTGEASELGIKLVDLMREKGFRVVYLGGERGDLPVEEYLVERVLYELRWQGANVVQLAPGRVIAYEHNRHTNSALRQAGIEVITFPGQLLALANGGPHCLLMPLLRGE